MISSLELWNYRAFKKESFNFSRLNIFVGPNNSGKSSALSALNLLAQSISEAELGSGPVVLNGKFDELGTFKDMVHGGRSNTPVRIAFSIDNFKYEFELKYRLQRREVELSKFKLKIRNKNLIEYITSKDRYEVKFEGVSIEDFGLGLKKTRPNMFGIIPMIRQGADFERKIRRSKEESLNVEKYRRLRMLESRVSRFRRLVVDEFRNYDTLGAFREMPKRTYLFSGETASNIGRFGENTVTMLASDTSKRGSERQGFVDEITKWMRATGISSGIKVKQLTDRHFELVVVGNDGVDHNICDVGFGCSQVLPVLVAGLNLRSKSDRNTYSDRNPTLVIQEPEIHLHPNAQAALGSFFAYLSNSEGQIFLETHSDNLVLRVARHVAAGDISAENVRIFYVSDDTEANKKVTPIQITEDGAFEPSWPGGFFPQRQQESLKLARAAMNKERNGNKSKIDYSSLEKE